jgi:hypothetical protein
MEKYLGEFDVVLKDTHYASYTPTDWAMEFIKRYSQTDGAHHKQWVLDQVARILKGTPVIVKEAKWANGSQEYRLWLDEPSKSYLDWVRYMKGEWHEEVNCFEYDYDAGIAP